MYDRLRIQKLRWGLLNNPGKGEVPIANALIDRGEIVHRQHSIGRYFVDIALPRRNLVIEVDDRDKFKRAKPKTVRREEDRQAFIESQGWKVLRVDNRTPPRAVWLLVKEVCAPSAE